MIIRVLNVGDSKQVARLHKSAFSSFFLTKLGFRFLTEFYVSIFKSKESIKLGLFKDENLVGFAIGAQNSKSFYSNILKRNFLRLGFSAFIPLLLNPLLIYRLYISLKTTHKMENSIEGNVILLSICVDPLESTKGNGTVLLSKFEEIAFEYSKLISLTTDSINNDYVNSFYHKNGYQLISSFLQAKREMNYYTKQKT